VLPWERQTFKWWIAMISFLTLLAAVVAMGAIIMASSKADKTVVQGGSSSAAPIDTSTEPGSAFVARDPEAPVADGATTHRITLEATEETLAIAPDVPQLMWTFGGQVPGPTLRGKVGDVFEITLVNKGENSHSIDFHASKVAWNDQMRSIAPGESLVYRFEAKHSGIFMYHCGTPPVIHHIGNGMYGAIIIDPPNLPSVDHEYVMVQSELYTAPAGEVASPEAMIAEEWNGIAFNGYVNQYLHRPIRVEPNQRVRIWVLDAGPSENSSFHVIGTIFDTVYKEGEYLLQPGPGRGGSQALDLQPAQGGFVEFTFDVGGQYPFVTHKFASASKGGVGMFQAGDVPVAEDAPAH
jgi:nitrite reductase (NO-forming)